MADQAHQPNVIPRIIIHGGSGNITRKTISKDDYNTYQASLQRILASSAHLLSQPGVTALDVATHAVSLLEDDVLYDSGKGSVFTREGRNELECSIMVSKGYRKRSVSCMMLQHVKNPIKLAKELLIRGEKDGGDGSQDHCQYSGAFVESLAQKWGLEMVQQEYFFTQKAWDEHKRGLEEERKQKQKEAEVVIGVAEMSDWEKQNYIPLGTCGAVVLDSTGTICTATSTGGLTNKVPGRIGDTPTIGAGPWAEEWWESSPIPGPQMLYQPSPTMPLDHLSRGNISTLVRECLPMMAASSSSSAQTMSSNPHDEKPPRVRHAVGISSTGNGDTFIRLGAASTTASKSRFTPTSLQNSVTWMAGPDGELQKSAGNRWGHSFEGMGGMIGIELVGSKGTVVQNYNCGGMLRAWIDEDGKHRSLVFREDSYESGPGGSFDEAT
jgi:L-asparaginase